jgi:hypothetical protein
LTARNFAPSLSVGALPKKPGALEWTKGWWYVTDGNDYFYYFFGDNDVIYIEQRPSPNFVPAKGHGAKGRVALNDHGVTITWNSGTGEVFTQWNWTDTIMMLAPAGRYAPLKATRMFT